MLLTVSKCYACSMQYTEIQRSFPLKPCFEVSIINPQLCLSKMSNLNLAKMVLKELNGVFEVEHNILSFHGYFTESMQFESHNTTTA